MYYTHTVRTTAKFDLVVNFVETFPYAHNDASRKDDGNGAVGLAESKDSTNEGSGHGEVF